MKIFLTKLFSILTKQDKRFFLFLVVFSVIISFIEMVGISAVLPFITIASDFDAIHSNEYIEKIYNYFHFTNDIDFIFIAGVFLVSFYIFRSVVNFIYLHLVARFSKGRYRLIAYRLFENYLGISYRLFIEKNISELNKTIITEANHLTALLYGMMVLISEFFVFIFIYGMMLYVNWMMTLLISLVLVFNAILLIMTVSRAIKKAGIEREEHERKFFEIIQSNLGNFKMLKLISCTKPILNSFDTAAKGYTSANIKNDTLTHAPRLFLEALGFGIIISLITYIVFKNQSDISNSMAMISMFILGLYRLMPSANRMLTGYNQIIYFRSSLDIIHNNLMYDTEDLKDTPVCFDSEINLKDISFEYKEGKSVLENININISKGDKVAFIGESGSGKSTLIDLILGLYRPKSGIITIDNISLDESNIKAWRDKVGYIPQSIYLFEGTVLENVAFGREYNEEKAIKVLNQANIMDFLNSHHEGIHTMVGDGGIKLSGGQRQRIAIARALYNNPEILVLDEATSALDTDTEAKIMEEIYKISDNKTLIIITHRLSTIKECKKIFKIVNKKLYIN